MARIALPTEPPTFFLKPLYHRDGEILTRNHVLFPIRQFMHSLSVRQAVSVVFRNSDDTHTANRLSMFAAKSGQMVSFYQTKSQSKAHKPKEPPAQALSSRQTGLPVRSNFHKSLPVPESPASIDTKSKNITDSVSKQQAAQLQALGEQTVLQYISQGQ